jgi:hypothetical protein
MNQTEAYLFTVGDVFNHLLQSTSTVLIGRNVNHRGSSIVNENRALLFGRKLKNLLTEVVAKVVLHKLNDVVLDLREDEVQVGLVALFNLLLEEAASVLVLGILKDLTFQLLKLSVGKLAVAY